MAIIHTTGSSIAGSNLDTVIVINASVTGSNSFHVELTNQIASGGQVQGMFHDGTNYIAFLVPKYRKSF